MMTEQNPYESYEKQLKTIFKIMDEQSHTTVELALHECECKVKNDHQEHFSLVFQGPEHPLLPQGSYQFKHEELGDSVLFMVPIGRNEKGIQYEVVINYIQ